ncbi:exonuclease domain-containing protein [Bacillus sp. 1P06AnD]|uniref:3'-5' exonuclease n=1 Tax=Bacillus sp. 1P06AnD TaxID=3132208 RepID=UPI0039A0B200
MEVERIKGGWANVPENLKTKTQLNKIGLKPIDENKPRAEVWSYKSWYKLYDIELDTKAKKKPSEAQLSALQKALDARLQKLTCERCNKPETAFKHLVLLEGIKLCRHCYGEAERKLLEQLGKECALQTFGKWYKEDFYILDTETTSLEGEVIEISIVDAKGSVIFNELVKPFGPISLDAKAIHGITEEMLDDKPTFKEIYKNLKPILENKLILIFNEIFDREAIFRSCDNWKLKTPNWQTDCVMKAYADYIQTDRYVSLANASGQWPAHRALNDCQSTLKVIQDVWADLDLIEEKIE